MREVKPFKTLDEQIDILIDRGLIIEDRLFAKKSLSMINYYRFSAYTLTLRTDNTFYNNVTFNNVLDLYYFDKELRGLLMRVLESIEVSMRTHISYHHSKKYGPLGYEDSHNFYSQEWYEDFVDDYMKCVEKYSHNEKFIKHHKENYGGKFPLWVLIETLTFGALSKLFSNLKSDVQNEIRKAYYNNIPIKYIKNWLHAATILRNICAHQGRLYNREISYPVLFSKNDGIKLKNVDMEVQDVNKKLFGYLIVLKKIIPKNSIWNDFLKCFKNNIKKYPFVLLKYYGFPDNWEEFLN